MLRETDSVILQYCEFLFFFFVYFNEKSMADFV